MPARSAFLARLRAARPQLAGGWVWAVWPWFIAASILFQRLTPVWENDVFVHVRLGLWILNGSGTGGDPAWTFGPAQADWINTLAAPEVLMALAYRLGGFALIAAAAALLGAAVTAMVWWALAALAPRQARLSPGPARAAMVVQFLIVAALFDGLRERPQVVSLLLLPVLGVWAVRLATTGRVPHPVAVVALVWPWAWLHGYALLAAPVLGLAAAAYVAGTPRGRRWDKARALARPLSVSAAVAVAATVATPAGPGIYLAALRLRVAAGDFISEWGPAGFSLVQPWIVLILAAVWGFAALWQAAARPGIPRPCQVTLAREGLLLAGTVVVFLPVCRTTFIAAILTGLIAGRRLMRAAAHTPARPWERWRPAPAVRAATTYLPLAVLGAWAAAWVVLHPGLAGVDATRVPLPLFAQIAAAPGPRDLLVDYNISGAAGMLIPDARTSIDGRVDRYGPRGAWAYYHNLTGGLGPDWADLLASYAEADMAVLDASSPLRQVLLEHGWVRAGSGSGGDGDEQDYLWLVPGPGADTLAQIAATAVR